ncbi:hypothetical protein L5515_017380 [Caenorhabditis briggsae]|uniref:Uncharacterized protein n=1 Tax=Caenorhabditis briggsae TaxID=6238 RepID=A0AAE9JSI6_CAEBR|nr:hypothetical protein L5515_017380 [Caenorhabditis briggsae]
MLNHKYWDQVRSAPTNVPVQNEPANEPSTSETGPSDPLFLENNPFFNISKSLLTMNNAKPENSNPYQLSQSDYV